MKQKTLDILMRTIYMLMGTTLVSNIIRMIL